MDCKTEAVRLMHKVLDGEAGKEETRELNQHLENCAGCRRHFNQLEKALMMVNGTAYHEAPDNLKGSIMHQLPKKERSTLVQRWLKRYPVRMAAIMLVVLAGAYLLLMWAMPLQVSVRGDGHVTQAGDTAVVPRDEIISGDVIVRGGNLEVYGEVTGDVTVVGGRQHTEVAGKVDGNVREINKAGAWIGYQFKHLLTGR